MTPSDSSNCPKCGSGIPADAPAGLCPKCVLEGAAATPGLTRNTESLPASVQEIAPHFPDLEVLELIGAGGMGAVYKARQPQLDRMVALKILSHDLASDPSFTERFNREAKVLARLSHPNIVGVHDYGTAGPYCYLMMEYVDGVNLRQAMQAGRFTPAESLAMVENICAALKFAHEEGILHRDIKPENVLIDSKGRVKIADFGIAKLAGDDPQADVTLTMRGSVLGSPHYMAPEQIETPDDVDQRADIYSLGVVFYELLTGELPLGRFALPSKKTAMDARIDDIVLRTLEKERQARFQSADEVMTQVGAVAQSPSAPAPANRPATSTDADASARFSLASAILTGVSIVIFIAGLIITNSFSYKLATLLISLTFLLAGIPGIIGLIFGIVALCDIRRSEGRKTGLGVALFGTTAWPILLMPLLGSLFLMAPMPGSKGPGIPVFVLPLFALLTMFTAGFVLVRTLRRWAGGVERDDGGRDFPGVGRGLVLSVLIALAGPLLLMIVPHFLPDSGRPDRFSEMEMEMEREMLDSTLEIVELQEASGQFQWFHEAPEVVLPVEIHPGLRVDFRLLRDEPGPRYADIGSWQGFRNGGPPMRSFIKIGSSGPKGEGLDQERGFTALLEFTGESGTTTGESDFSGWTFEAPKPGALNFATPGQFSIQIGTRNQDIDGQSKLTGVLRLEVTVTEL